MGAMQRNNFDRTQTVAEFIVALEGVGYNALPVGYVLRGKHNESYVITEVVGYTDCYITYKARLGTSYTAGSGDTLTFKEYYLYEWFMESSDVRRSDGSLDLRFYREPFDDSSIPDFFYREMHKLKLESHDSFQANNTVYYVRPINHKSFLRSCFKKRYIVIGVVCVLVLVGGVWLYNTDRVSNHETEIVQPSEDITIFMDSINEPRLIEDTANFVPKQKIEVETKDRQITENARPAPEQKKEESLTDEELFARARTIEDYTALAEKGYAPAQFRLGLCYNSGDYEKAVYWYTKAAEQGYAYAQYNLGVCYNSGNGVSKDYKKAVYWFTKAAEQGDVYAQYNLGKCYEYGNGVTKNLSIAKQWYKKAADQGHKLAEASLMSLDIL